jgi:hypothetical protein
MKCKKDYTHITRILIINIRCEILLILIYNDIKNFFYDTDIFLKFLIKLKVD